MSLTRRQILQSLAGTLVAAQLPGVRGVESAKKLQSKAVCLTDFEALAEKRLSHMAYQYIAGGAGDEITIRWNREAYDSIKLRPRVLAGSEAVNTGLTLFGQSLPHPILLAPTAFHRLAHPEGEVATARGAGAADAIFVVSSFTTRRLADIAHAAKGLLWFQFFDLRKDQESFIRDAVQEAEALGCKALCVTVDAPTTGPRNRQERASFKIPEEFETPYYPDRRTRKSAKGLPITGGFGWNDIERVLRMSKLPLLLKGILDPDDAEQAIKAGVQGLIVSNHGGRCLDTVPASIEALPRIAERVGGRVPLLVDGGIRRGTDVLKALALGASAVLVGRPYLYALGVEGERGVERVVNMLKSELEMAMILAGRASLGKLDRSVIW